VDVNLEGSRAMLEVFAGTALNSKLISNQKDLFAPMVMNACSTSVAAAAVAVPLQHVTTQFWGCCVLFSLSAPFEHWVAFGCFFRTCLSVVLP